MKLDVHQLHRMYAALPHDTDVKPFDLRDVMRWPRLPVTVPALKPHRGLAKPRLNLADYVVSGAQAPDSIHRSNLGFKWGALLNNTLGDCGIAMILHAFEAYHLDAGTPVPPWRNQDALYGYEKVGGYVPGQPSTDQGVDNDVLFKYMVNPGMLCSQDESSHKLTDYLFVPADPNLMRIAIWEFVVLYRAYNMPITAQSQHEWALAGDQASPSAQPGSWGGHDVPLISYDPNRFRTISWGEELLIDAPAGGGFDAKYGMQAIVGVTPEMLNRQGVSPSGVDWTKLNVDLKAL